MNKKNILRLFFGIIAWNAMGQEGKIATNTTSNLHHTKIELHFNETLKQLEGTATLTLSPHFYPVNKLVLNAKDLAIKTVRVTNTALPFEYKKDKIFINLAKTYEKGETYTLSIDYSIKPKRFKQNDVNPTDKQGMLINTPKNNTHNSFWVYHKPNEAGYWFPTIDTPRQKTTQELFITLPENLTALASGQLISSKKQANGKKVEHWSTKQNLSPSSYFFAVGNFFKVEKEENGLKSIVYLDEQWKSIGNHLATQSIEMIRFFEDLTGYHYPWETYQQLILEEAPSQLTSYATLSVFNPSVYQLEEELVDDNPNEALFAKAVSKQWFGHLISPKNKTNAALTEALSSYGAYLWISHKHGKELADIYLNQFLLSESYKTNSILSPLISPLHEESAQHNFIGGYVIHMLRNLIKDDAFFKSIKTCFSQYNTKGLEVDEFRLITEDISGHELKWFFDQWFFQPGFLGAFVSFDFNTLKKTVGITIKQRGSTYTFPLSIDFYEKNQKVNHQIWVSKSEESFFIPFSTLPKYIDLNPNYTLLADFSESLTLDKAMYKFKNSKHLLSKQIALKEIVKHQKDNDKAFDIVVEAIKNGSDEIQLQALKAIDLFQKQHKKKVLTTIEQVAYNEKETLVKAEAITVLGKVINPLYRNFFLKELNSNSFAIQKSALFSLYQVDRESALKWIETLDERKMERMPLIMTDIFIREKDTSKIPFIANSVLNGIFYTQNARTQKAYLEAFNWVAKSKNTEAILNITHKLVALYKEYINDEKFQKIVNTMLNKLLESQEMTTDSDKDKRVLIIKEALANVIK